MSKIKQVLKKVGLNGFFVALLAAIFLAYLFPEWGSDKSWVPLDQITYYGISLIFFFYGVKLDPAKLGGGLKNWKLHVVIQSTTFLLFPLMVLVIKSIFGSAQSNLWLGAFYLSALPSTVSASVVMVSIAGGNIPAAIFNASISSIVGVFLTPVWMELFLNGAGMEFDLLTAFWKLSLQVLFPVIAGFILHRILGRWVQKYNQTLKYFDQTIILCIVFSAFSASFEREMFAGHSWTFLFGLAGLMLGLFLWMAALMYGIGKGLGFNKEDQITVLFCGSKKSLVQGAAMGRVLFPDPVTFGVILLPLMIYHSLQLVAGSVIAQQLAQQMKLSRRSS